MEFQENELQEMKENYCQELLLVGREGTSKLIKWLDENGFFTDPCSTQYHLSCEGGLLRHSLNVANMITKLNNAAFDGQDKKKQPDYLSMVLVALLHDIGKVGDHGKPYYVENILKSGKRSDSKPFETNSSLLNIPHEIRSVIIAERFIRLTEEEEHAILYHNGMYSDLKYQFNGREQPLDLLLHFADMWVSRITEIESEGE